MKTLEISSTDISLATLVRELGPDPVALTDGGVRIAVLLSVKGADLETVSLSFNPKFQDILEQSRRSYWQEGGISSDEMRRRLGIEVPEKEKPKNNRRKRKAE